VLAVFCSLESIVYIAYRSPSLLKSLKPHPLILRALEPMGVQRPHDGSWAPVNRFPLSSREAI
jgi:hypothetical protein